MLIRTNSLDLRANPQPGLTVHFPDGIPGFGDVQNFAVSTSIELTPFVKLSSEEAGGVGFLCIDPFDLASDYKIKLNKGIQRKLLASDPADIVVLAMVTRADRPENFTANLLAPLVLNVRNQVGKQVILEKYPVKVNVLEALRRSRTEQEVGNEKC